LRRAFGKRGSGSRPGDASPVQGRWNYTGGSRDPRYLRPRRRGFVRSSGEDGSTLVFETK
jgi:hypothetical protein